MVQPLEPNDSKLRTSCKRVTKRELRTNAVQHEIEQLLDYVYGTSNKGESRDKRKPMTVGLSANQVGFETCISIVDVAIAQKRFNEVLVLVNPEITWKSRTIREFDESCLNIPEVWGWTKNRSNRVKVSALTRSGQDIHLDVNGAAAVLLQHEIDHLNGTLFIDHLEDPTRACLVKSAELSEYKNARRRKRQWRKRADVSHLVRS